MSSQNVFAAALPQINAKTEINVFDKDDGSHTYSNCRFIGSGSIEYKVDIFDNMLLHYFLLLIEMHFLITLNLYLL